jgi:hypothetical protein
VRLTQNFTPSDLLDLLQYLARYSSVFDHCSVGLSGNHREDAIRLAVEQICARSGSSSLHSANITLLNNLNDRNEWPNQFKAVTNLLKLDDIASTKLVVSAANISDPITSFISVISSDPSGLSCHRVWAPPDSGCMHLSLILTQ